MKDEELQPEEIEASHTLGGPVEIALSAKDFFNFLFLFVYLVFLPSSHVSFAVLVVLVIVTAPLFFILQGVVKDR